MLNVHFDMRLACPARCWMMASGAQGHSYMQLSQVLLAGTAVRFLRCRCGGGGPMQMSTCWIGELNNVAVLPTIRLGISRRDLNVSPLSFGFCRIHPQTAIALLDHRRVSLAIHCEPHHQLRNAHRKSFILVGVPRVPCLPVGMGKPLHQRMFSSRGYAWCNQLTGRDFIAVAVPHRLRWPADQQTAFRR